jgi:hypothetical protein
MGLNTKCPVNASFLEKWITVGKLKELLSGMEDSWELLPNSVGNLSVFTPLPDSEEMGYIDISNETYNETFENDGRP